ncbi:voltage-gated potassium channel [Hymenobacter gelipurpurascens]|uniref:Voltage-gated potassium channel n=1 Tax=Hymenobacter gelipurpurascens TaxID=89968 RepID=A0A212UHH0_9BACT|nr:ion transporter [Hymenobacter gelipurpurascens]SNC77524.1 voltage-gated potassium channel [Hymenobacter gelipurpurascens]
MESKLSPAASGWRQRAYSVIFEADTPEGRLFDIALLWAIVLSVLAVMLESVREINAVYGYYLRIVEWGFTALFLLEYLARLVVVRRPLTYAFSLLGIIDFLSVVPTLISLAIAGNQYLLVIRTLRLLRVFRIFKLGQFVGEGEFIVTALKASRYKIMVFLTAVLTLVIIIGTLMYVIEGGQNGFTSIPKSIYWAIVTLTTVGYGDISPTTVLGQTLASVLMILGYAIIAVPTGIVSAQMATPRSGSPAYKQVICHECQATDHKPEAEYCWRCGEKL